MQIIHRHLGGFIHNDSNSYERQLWEVMIEKFSITSVLDVGCGMGYSTLFFKKHPSIERVLCVEGSSEAVNNSLVPDDTVQHDYTLGPYWPSESYDMLWSLEFLEHVEEKYLVNIMSTFKKAKLLFVSASEQGGWSHVNVRKRAYWVGVFESYGFVYLPNVTELARVNSPGFKWQLKYSYHNQLKENGDRKYVYFYYTGMVFLNPLFVEPNIERNRTLFDNLLLRQLHS